MDFLMRSSPNYAVLPMKVDRTTNVIHGVNAMTAFVEAIGHGVMADLTTLSQFSEQGNAKTNGVRGRFGHPAISEQGAGRQVQLARNFRVEGNHLLHDSYLLETARKSPAFNQDPIEFILEVAEKAPTEFAESVVAAVDLFWVLDDEGNERELSDKEYGNLHWKGGVDAPEDSIYELPVMRLKPNGYKYTDFVSEGALTHNGLFEGSVAHIFQGHSSEYALELFDLVDRWRAQYQIPLEDIERKTQQLVQKYLFTRKDRDMSVTDDAIARRKQTRQLGRQALALEAQPDIELDPEDEEEDAQTKPQVEGEDEDELAADDAPATPPAAPPTTPLETPNPVPAGTEIAANLKAVQSRMTSLEEDVEKSSAENERFNLLQDQILAVNAKVDQLTADLQTASNLLVQQADWMQQLSNNVARLDGERIVTERVRAGAMNPHDRLEEITGPQEMLNNQVMNRHPQPALSAQYSTAGIDGVPPGLVLADDTPQTAAEKVVESQNRRQQAYRLQGSQNLPR